MSGEDAQYKKYYENMEVWQISEGKSDMDSETHEASTEECIRTIEEMQQAMTTAAKKLDENRRGTKPQEERGPNDSSEEKQLDKSATQGTATTNKQTKKKRATKTREQSIILYLIIIAPRAGRQQTRTQTRRLMKQLDLAA